MTDIDHEALRAWYRKALRERVAELEAARYGLASGGGDVGRAVHSIGQALRGSGGSFGFPEVTEIGSLLEGGADASLSRYVEGAIARLRAIAWADEPAQQRRHAWLATAAGADAADIPSDLAEAWAEVGRRAGIDEHELAERVARHFSMVVAELGDIRVPALRLVTHSACVDWGIVPLSEDDIHVHVATADPTDLATEAALGRVTGRIPLFEVAPPSEIHASLARVAAGDLAAPAPAPPVVPSEGPPTVLVVDDDADARLLAGTVLLRKGYTVVEAASGSEALEVVAGRPDVGLAVVDLAMPGMAGDELLRRLKGSESTAHVRVIVLTGASDPLTEASLIEEGADDYIRKPLDPRLFAARVSATLRRAGG